MARESWKTEAESATADRGVSVVIVDDEEDCRELLAGALCREGLHATPADTAGSAIEEALRVEVDVMIVDLRLGGEDGTELARALRDDPRTAPIALVAMSGLVEPEWSVVRHFDAYLRKPVLVERLPELCRSLARVSRIERARSRDARS